MNEMEWSGVLVWLEQDGQTVTELSLELLYKAKELARQAKEKVYGIMVRRGEGPLGPIQTLPLDGLFLYDTAEIKPTFREERALLECIQEVRPSIVLVGGTLEGRVLASRAAVSCRSGVTADCTELQLDKEGLLQQTRPAFGGDVMADIVTPQTRPQFSTVRQGIFPKLQWEGDQICPCVRRRLEEPEERDVLLAVEERQKKMGIEDASVLVVAGRGVKKKEDLELLEKLAHRLGGALASSRALVEKGWMRPDQQIGLSGKTVAPDLLITCGVSGSVQFRTGIRRAKCIVAINHDPEAGIFTVAHHSICCDLYQIVPQLLQRLE